MARWRRVLAAGAAFLGLGGLALGGVLAIAIARGEALLAFPDTPYPDLAASADPEVIARGRYLVHGPAHCATCHSTTDRDHPEQILTSPLQGGLAFAMGPLGTRYAANLTPDPETGIGRWSDAELARVIRTGVLPDGNLSLFMALQGNPSDEDVVAILSYLRSLEPVRNAVPAGEWYALAKALLWFGVFELAPRAAPPPAHVPPGDAPSIERGRYLAEDVALCVFCHSEVDPGTFRIVGPKAGGGTPEASHGEHDAHMEYAPPNLTSHPTGYTGKVDEDAFVARIRAGRAHASSIMPWENLGQASESDLRSIYRYLRSLPPVDRDVGPSYRPVGWKP